MVRQRRSLRGCGEGRGFYDIKSLLESSCGGISRYLDFYTLDWETYSLMYTMQGTGSKSG